MEASVDMNAVRMACADLMITQPGDEPGEYIYVNTRQMGAAINRIGRLGYAVEDEGEDEMYEGARIRLRLLLLRRVKPAIVAPIVVGTRIDFTGDEYEVEELPDPAQCAEGDTCVIHWPGNSGWYETRYALMGGVWVETSTTAPWQMFV